jgi:AcrR family transcriptional regulator
MSRGAVRREQILDAALEALRAVPVAEVQLAEIADRAGMRPAHVLYYFGSREGVLAAVAERLRDTRDGADYLPHDRHDPYWKLRIDGWLRGGPGDAEQFALDGLALHVLAGHLTRDEAVALAEGLTR